MSSKIGDVYDGGRKIGEIHRSGGMGGCMSGILVLIAVIGGLIYLVTIGVNYIRYGADTPADATAKVQVPTETAQAAICASSQPPSPPPLDTLAQSAKSYYDAEGGDVMMNMRDFGEIQQSGCTLYLCITYDVTSRTDGNILRSERDQFEFDYSFDSAAWKATSWRDGAFAGC